MSTPRLLVVINPGASRVATNLGQITAALAANGFEFDLRQPATPQAVIDTIRTEAGNCDAVLLGGGDGTVNLALDALLDAAKPVGILPLGTANDLALTLGIPTDPESAAAVIAAWHPHRIDVGRANGVSFVNASSVGLAVDIARRQDPERKQQWRVLSYLLTTIEVLGEAQRFRATIDCDGQRIEVDTYQIAVGNGVYYGGGMRISEAAAIDDGFLDVYAIEAETIGELMALAPAMRAGTHTHSEGVTSLRGRRVSIETQQPMSVNTDGELTTQTPVEYTVDRSALEIFVPPLII